MADHARKRLSLYKTMLARQRDNWRLWKKSERDLPLPEFIRAIECDPRSLERAAIFFELDHSHPQDRSVLIHILAEILFGTRKRGKKTGDKVWTDNRFLMLAFKYRERKSSNPNCNDTEIAELISKEPEFNEYRNNPELIRQRLSRARREYDVWWEYTMDEAEADSRRDSASDTDPADYADYDDYDDRSA
jgi:hypothetical protein